MLVVLCLNPNVFAVRAESEDNLEEIVVVDKTKINVDNAKVFTVGDIDGDKKMEVITFKSIVKKSCVQWLINTYHIDGNIWYPVLSKIIMENVVGHIHKIDVGNFDKDSAQEIIIVSWEGNSSKIYLLNFDKNRKEFDVQVVYELNTFVSDFEVHSNAKEFSDTIYVLFSDGTDSPENFATKIMTINCDKKGNYRSEIIYSAALMYWSLFTIGLFINQYTHMNQILLYQYKTTASQTSEAIVSIIDSEGEPILDDLSIGTYSKIRDIIAWDRNSDGIDELCLLSIKDMGDEVGFNSNLIYCSFSRNGIVDKEDRLINSNKILNQICVITLGNGEDKLLALDPYLGSMTYARFFDEEARAYYDYWGYNNINGLNWNFDVFELMYENDLDIYVTKSGDYDYTSSGSTSSELISDFSSKVDPDDYNVDIAIGVSHDLFDDMEVLGRGYQLGDKCIILGTYWGVNYRTICHEVGHNYGLSHCSNLFCIMYFAPIVSTDFCDDCENSIDKDKFGPPYPPPPPPGGCPILYTFDGTEYIEEGLLDIHDLNGIDKTYIHTLKTTPIPFHNKISLRLIEHHKTISHIDTIRLCGKLAGGQWVTLDLTSAIHSALGNVKNLLRHSDDVKVIELGADHNYGVSESIDLEFTAPSYMSIVEFVFIIEGNNILVK